MDSERQDSDSRLGEAKALDKI
ncbi:hypothetical protein A2U01_0092431, partial [Trifolium medium]|nr:hypothetical protein [Trifolium medium]